jgi:hypothetical protein
LGTLPTKVAALHAGQEAIKTEIYDEHGLHDFTVRS